MNVVASKILTALVTLDNLDEMEESLRVTLREFDLHTTQIETIIARTRELMQAGMGHAEALMRACDEVGDPAGKADFFWDEKLARQFGA